MNKSETLSLKIIKTDKCCFVNGRVSIGHLLFDGKNPEPTFEPKWFKVASEPTEIMRLIPSTKDNYRMELNAEFLEGSGFSGTTLGKLSPSIPRDECMRKEDYDWVWKDTHKHLSSLYTLKWDDVAHDPEPVEFELVLYCEIPNLEEYAGMSYEVLGYWEHSDAHQQITDRHIGRRAIDTIIYPSVLHPSCTATMSSDRLFEIIRFHIKQNIDYRYADITSDYKLGFTVQKRIVEAGNYDSLAKSDVNKPQISFKTNLNSTVFEMTPANKKDAGYTVLPSMSAKNNKALKRKIDKYLADLMTYINEPIILCPHCGGQGCAAPIRKMDHPKQEE